MGWLGFGKSQRVTEDHPILDANDAVRWSVGGLVAALPYLVLVAFKDALNISFLTALLLAVPSGLVYGVVRGLLRRAIKRLGNRNASEAPLA